MPTTKQSEKKPRRTPTEWARMGVFWWQHERFTALVEPNASALFWAMVCWSNANKQDGRVPANMVTMLAAAVGADPVKAPADLQRVGLVRHTKGSYTVHRFLTWQDSAEQRAKRSEVNKRNRAGGNEADNEGQSDDESSDESSISEYEGPAAPADESSEELKSLRTKELKSLRTEEDPSKSLSTNPSVEPAPEGFVGRDADVDAYERMMAAMQRPATHGSGRRAPDDDDRPF
jgi:hypothetical protein